MLDVGESFPRKLEDIVLGVEEPHQHRLATDLGPNSHQGEEYAFFLFLLPLFCLEGVGKLLLTTATLGRLVVVVPQFRLVLHNR